jgi:hypothetical protein
LQPFRRVSAVKSLSCKDSDSPFLQKIQKSFAFGKSRKSKASSEALIPANCGHSFRFSGHKFFLEARARRLRRGILEAHFAALFAAEPTY